MKTEADQHVFYQFMGWRGPEGVNVAFGDTLKNWRVSKIIWRRRCCVLLGKPPPPKNA